MSKKGLLNNNRRLVASKAADLMYLKGEREYKTAKLKASRSLGYGNKHLPSNAEIKEQINMLANIYEGEYRQENLILMRRIALNIMFLLHDFYPRLIGSVWRGDITYNSDIDIHTFGNVDSIICKLEQAGLNYAEDVVEVEKRGELLSIPHIYIDSLEFMVEICIYDINERNIYQTCSIFQNKILGWDTYQLAMAIDELDKYHIVEETLSAEEVAQYPNEFLEE